MMSGNMPSLSTMSIQEANFVDRWINGKYRVKMPKFLAAHDSFDNWERERFASMEEHLKQGDVLFDVGAETGHISAVYARFVGPGNMVLFESNPDNWQNIKATWDAEGYVQPLATFCGLVSDRSQTVPTNYDTEQIHGWPVPAHTGQIWTPRSYRYLHEHFHNTDQVSLDDFVNRNALAPTAITIDVEGAELSVLIGAKTVLQANRPLVWVSLHPDLMRDHYQSSVRDVNNLMHEVGYEDEFLANDHEVHMFYKPR